jgi:drug/metabolite transporter (DMT)-like permease
VSRTSGVAAFWMMGASLAFAGMATLIKLSADHHVPIAHIIFFRGLVSAAIMLVFLHAKETPVATPHLKAHLVRGCVGFATMLAYVVAIASLPVATAVTLNYTSPLLLVAILLVIHRERPSPVLIAAMLTGLGGVVLLSSPIYVQSQWLGGCFALLSAVLGALSALNIRMLGRLGEPPARTVLYFSLFITLASLPAYLLTHPLAIDLAGLLYVCSAAAFATVGQWMITVAYQRGHAPLMSLLGYSQVVFTTLLGIALWSDKPPMTSWLGMALIIGSGAVAIFFVRPPDAAAIPATQPSAS